MADEVAVRSRTDAPSVRFATARDYIALTKPRITPLLLLAALAGMYLGGPPPLGIAIAVLVAGALAASGANTLNQYLDRDLDALMRRTRGRPIPAGRVAPGVALWLGVALTAGSLAILLAFTNALAAGLTLAASACYVFVYTVWLKRRSTQNIVIGGAAGAIPPLIGAAAVHGEVTLAALSLFGIVLLWTPAHFWALAVLLRDDYARAGIPMLPVVRSPSTTARGILAYTVATVAASLVPYLLGTVGREYLAAAAILGAVFVTQAIVYQRRLRRADARRIYVYSLAYLAALFVAVIATAGG